MVNALRPPAECTCESDKVGKCLRVAVAVTGTMIKFLPLSHHPHATVVAQDYLNRAVMLYGSGEFLDVH